MCVKILRCICLIQDVYCCDKTPWLGEEFILSQFYTAVHHQKQWGAGTQAGQEPGGRSWWRSHGTTMLTGLLPMACSVCFLIEPRTTSPGMAPLTMGWALPDQSLRKGLAAWSFLDRASLCRPGCPGFTQRSACFCLPHAGNSSYMPPPPPLAFTAWSYRNIFSTEFSSFQIILACVKLT